MAAREISRTPLPAITTLENAPQNTAVVDRIYDPNLVVFDRSGFTAGDSFFEDVVPTRPLLNQQLATLMITDGELIRYPGALLPDFSTPTGFTVGIPLVVGRDADGVETIRWIPVVEEIESAASPDPFSLDSDQQGVVALSINHPFQSASMSSCQPHAGGPTEPTSPGRKLPYQGHSATGLQLHGSSLHAPRNASEPSRKKAVSATGWPRINAEPRLGLQHRTQLATPATEGGWSNRCAESA